MACTELYIEFYRPKQWSNCGQLTQFHHTVVRKGSYPSHFWQSHVAHFPCRCITKIKMYTYTKSNWSQSLKDELHAITELEASKYLSARKVKSTSLYNCIVEFVLIVNISTFSRDLSRSLTSFQLCTIKSQCILQN